MCSKPTPPESPLLEALALMGKALDLMDVDGTVGIIAAQLEMARGRLAEHLGVELFPPDDLGSA
jgi:hypothetical protein